MALSVKQRRWFLGGALTLTLIAVVSSEGKDEPANEIVEPGQVKKHQFQRPADGEQTAYVPLAALNRQPLPENAKDMFAGKSWYVPPPPPKAAPPSAPPLPFIYMGKLAEQGEKVVVLLNKQGRDYTVREGDILDNIYRVDEVRAPAMTLTYLPLNIKQTIRIGESN